MQFSAQKKANTQQCAQAKSVQSVYRLKSIIIGTQCSDK
jgi:hypothetical protein